MSAVFEAVSDVVESVGDAVGDVIDVAVDVVEDVGHAVENVVNNALENPVATIATIVAIAAAPATGGASLELIPAINAANTLAQGGSFEDALTSAAISYVAQGVGNYVGGQLGTSLEYGTDLGSAQTAQLAAQTGDMLGGTTSGTIGGAAGSAAAGATAAALSGGDIDQAMINALGNYAIRTGVNYTVNSAGRLIDEFGNEAPPEVANEIIADAENQPVNATIVDNGDGTFTQTFDDGSTLTTDTGGNVISSTTYDGQVILPGGTDAGEAAPLNVPQTRDPYEIDNMYNRDEGQELVGIGGVPSIDPFEVDNVGNRSEDEILMGQSPDLNLPGAAWDYLKNQFTNSLIRQIAGNVMPRRPSPMGARFKERPFGLAGTPGVSESLYNLNFSNLPTSGFTIPGAVEEGPFTPISLWDPGISEDWKTDQKLGGLGFAGKFINKEQPEINIDEQEEPVSSKTKEDDSQPNISDMAKREVVDLWDPGVSEDWGSQDKLSGLGFSGSFINQDEDYINAPADERQRIIDEIRQRGWMTEEERAMLEQNSGFFDIDNENLLADASPWYSTEYAQGGHIDHKPEFYSEGGASLANRYVKGNGDGTSDSVPAMLASGEFVIPADVVSGLGNGDNDAGAKVLDEFMAAIRQDKRSTNPRELPPDSKGPLAYLAKATKKVGKNGRA